MSRSVKKISTPLTASAGGKTSKSPSKAPKQVLGPDEVPFWAAALANSLLEALKERDPYTYGHSRRVARNARLLAKASGLNYLEQKIIEYASIFHDLGKISIPDSILNKPGRLDPKEEEVMRSHPVKSVEIVKPLTEIPFFKSTIAGIQSHHERVDGRGYPDGIPGDQIPLPARIIVIADTFDAMTTTRPYRRGLPFEVAYNELKLFSGRQFDEQLVKVFLQAHPKWQQHDEEITEDFITANFKRAA